MKLSPLLVIGALIMSASVSANAKNFIAGTWTIESGKADPKGTNQDLFGPNPSGQLIFTEDMHFAVVINDPSVRQFSSSDRSKGTAAENKAAVVGALALYGTYYVDRQGRFAGEHVVGSTFPNWNGIYRTIATLSESVKRNTMIERLQDPGGPLIEIVWKRAPNEIAGK